MNHISEERKVWLKDNYPSYYDAWKYPYPPREKGHKVFINIVGVCPIHQCVHKRNHHFLCWDTIDPTKSCIKCHDDNSGVRFTFNGNPKKKPAPPFNYLPFETFHRNLETGQIWEDCGQFWKVHSRISEVARTFSGESSVTRCQGLDGGPRWLVINQDGVLFFGPLKPAVYQK